MINQVFQSFSLVQFRLQAQCTPILDSISFAQKQLKKNFRAKPGFGINTGFAIAIPGFAIAKPSFVIAMPGLAIPIPSFAT